MSIQEAIGASYSIRTVLFHANKLDKITIVIIGSANFFLLATNELNHHL